MLFKSIICFFLNSLYYISTLCLCPLIKVNTVLSFCQLVTTIAKHHFSQILRLAKDKRMFRYLLKKRTYYYTINLQTNIQIASRYCTKVEIHEKQQDPEGSWLPRTRNS